MKHNSATKDMFDDYFVPITSVPVRTAVDDQSIRNRDNGFARPRPSILSCVVPRAVRTVFAQGACLNVVAKPSEDIRNTVEATLKAWFHKR